MSSEKIERILATYKPVADKPGYVWVSDDAIVELNVIRKIYEEQFAKIEEDT